MPFPEVVDFTGGNAENDKIKETDIAWQLQGKKSQIFPNHLHEMDQIV